MRIAEAVGGVLMLILALFALQHSIALQLWSYGGPGPGLFPFILGILLAPMAAVYLGTTVYRLVRERRGAPRHVSASFAGSVEGGEEEGPVNWFKVAGYVACLVAFAVGMHYVGWKIALAVAVFALTAGIERVGLRKAAVYTAAFLLGSYLLFELGLAVPLPNGTLW